MTPAVQANLDLLRKLTSQWESTIDYLGDGAYRVRLAWDGTCADGRKLEPYSHDALLRIEEDGTVTSYLVLGYVMNGEAYSTEDLANCNDIPQEVFKLDSYIASVNFDAVFG